MIDRPDSRLREGERPGSRPAAHRCWACNAKVDIDAEEDAQHACVLDPAGPIESHGQRWRATTIKAAREERERKERERRAERPQRDSR